MRNLKITFLVFFIIITAAFMQSAFGQDKIIAIVNKDIITQKDLDDFINFMRVQLSKDYNGKKLDAKIQTMESDLLDRLIEDRLILQEAKKLNLKADENMVKAKLGEIRKNFDSEADFEKSIAQEGVVEQDLMNKIRDQILMYNLIEIKVRQKLIISPNEITNFYYKNSEKFKDPEKRDFLSLAVTNDNLSKNIYQQLLSGKSAEDLAKDNTVKLSQFTARKGGELRKEIEDKVFNMKIGEISEPIKIDENFYIFKLNNIIPPKQNKLSEVQDSIKMFLYETKMQEELVKYIDGLKKKSYIKIEKE